MKALSLWQPWASLIAYGYKRFETRSWPTRYRGRLAIHAAKRPPKPEELELHFRLPDGKLARIWPETELPLGAVVAIVELVDVHRMTPGMIESQTGLELAVGDWRPGRFAWEVANVEPLEPPMPARGGQGLWEWAPDLSDLFGEVEGPAGTIQPSLFKG